MYLIVNETKKIENDDIFSYNLTKNATPSSELTLGGCCISVFNISFDNRSYKDFQFNNAKIEVFNDNEYKLGEFWVDTPGVSNHVMSLECSDSLRGASVKWIGRSFPCTVYEIYTSILTQLGINSIVTPSDLPCSNCIVNESTNLKNMTCMDLLSDIAEINGGFFFVNVNGDLEFKIFDFSNPMDYNEDYLKDAEIEQITTTRKGLMLVGSGNKVHTFGDTSNQLKIMDNEIIKTLTDDNINLVGNSLLENIKHYEYNAATVSLWQDNKPCELGDVIKVVDIDGVFHSIIIHEISYSNSTNFCEIESYGDDIKTKATQETSQIENETTMIDDSDINMGRGQNHQRILAKAGTYTLCEEMVTEVTSFSKVFLNLFVEFDYSYEENRILFFNIYSNDKLVKALRCKTDQGFNQYSVGFLADVDLEKDTNLYSVKITLLEDETITITEFDCQLSFITKACKIKDAVATDQYFIEKYTKISNGIFNQKRFTIKDLMERVEIKIPMYSLDISETPGVDKVSADWYEDGVLEISGYGRMKSAGNGISQMFYEGFGRDAALDIITTTQVSIVGVSNVSSYFCRELKSIEKITIGSGVKNLEGDSAFANISTLQEVVFKSNEPLSISGNNVFSGCTSLTTITNERRITSMTGSGIFYGCALNGTYDFSNCELWGCDGCFSNNKDLDYIKLPAPLKRESLKSLGELFLNCNQLDSVVVLDNATIQEIDENNGIVSSLSNTAFKGSTISTFMFLSDVEAINPSFLHGLACENPTLYVCGNYDADESYLIHELATDYGFTLVWYDKEEEQNILNQIYK